MKRKDILSQKWGLFDITDEQAEKINVGDIEEYNAFFLRNFEVIKSMCINLLRKYSNIYYSEKDIFDLINACYYDLYRSRFENSKVLIRVIKYACLAVDRSSTIIAKSVSPDCYNFHFKNEKLFVDLYSHGLSYYSLASPFSCQSYSNEDKLIIDDYEVCPSPQDEIELEESTRNSSRILSIVTPFIPSDTLPYFDFWLNGIRPAHCNQRMNVKNASAKYKKIQNAIIQNSTEILHSLTKNGYHVPKYLYNAIPC